MSILVEEVFGSEKDQKRRLEEIKIAYKGKVVSTYPCAQQGRGAGTGIRVDEKVIEKEKPEGKSANQHFKDLKAKADKANGDDDIKAAKAEKKAAKKKKGKKNGNSK